jgi:hypothetical protein
VNILNAELNSVCHLLALLAQPVLHISRIRVNFAECIGIYCILYYCLIEHSLRCHTSEIVESKSYIFVIIFANVEKILVWN